MILVTKTSDQTRQRGHTLSTCVCVCVCVCVFFPFFLDIKFVTSRGHTGGRSHRISRPPSFCGACLYFSREKDSAIPFPRRPLCRILCTNDLIVLYPLGIFILIFLFFSEKNPVCRDRTHVPTCQRLHGTSELPGRPECYISSNILRSLLTVIVLVVILIQ